jgi:hypothetical protein
MVAHAEDMLEANLLADAIPVAELEQPLANQRVDLALAVQRYGPDGAHLAVGNEQGRAVAGQTARLGETGFHERPIKDVFAPAAGEKLYVADTNNHRVRVVDLNTKAISTLQLHGLEAPKLAQGRVP